MRRVQPGQLGYRRHCQGIRYIRGRGRSSQRSVQRSKVGDGTPHNGKVELESTQTLPLAGGPGRVTFVKPQRHSNSDRLVEREMGELVSECAVQVVEIGAPHTGARPPERESILRASGTTISRRGPGERRPRPGHSVACPARRASSVAKPNWPDQATAVTCPTRTAVGWDWSSAATALPMMPQTIRKADCAGLHLRLRQPPASHGSVWPRD
jgi:hypothetical protein